MTNKPMYLSVSPQPVTGITIRRITVDGWDFQIILGNTAYFHISGQDACDLVFSLATAVHDAGFIDEATARRLAYIGLYAEAEMKGWDKDFDAMMNDQPIPHDDDYADEMMMGEQYEEGR